MSSKPAWSTWKTVSKKGGAMEYLKGWQKLVLVASTFNPSTWEDQEFGAKLHGDPFSHRFKQGGQSQVVVQWYTACQACTGFGFDA